MTTETRGRKRVYDPNATTRVCRMCEEELPVSDFNPDRIKKDGYLNIETRCIDCMRARKYGTTKKAIAARLADQNNACAICKTTFTKGLDTHIDHCHTTGAVRGILCNHCNHGLGKFRDNPDYLRAALQYLEC